MSDDSIGYVQVRVSKSIHDRLTKDKKHFEKTIGLKFSFNSTINEYHKILDGIDDGR